MQGRLFKPSDLIASIDKFDMETLDPEFFSTKTFGRTDMFNDTAPYAEFEWDQLKNFSKSEKMLVCSQCRS